jgi:hypothetical protein
MTPRELDDFKKVQQKKKEKFEKKKQFMEE